MSVIQLAYTFMSTRYQLPKVSHSNRVQLPRLDTEVYEKVKAEIKSVDNFACTIDYWTSRCNDNYLSFTVH